MGLQEFAIWLVVWSVAVVVVWEIFILAAVKGWMVALFVSAGCIIACHASGHFAVINQVYCSLVHIRKERNKKESFFEQLEVPRTI